MRDELPKYLPFILTKITPDSFNKNPCKYYKKGYNFIIDDEYCEDAEIGKYLYHITIKEYLKDIKKYGLKPSKSDVIEDNIKNPPKNFKAVYLALSPDDSYEANPLLTMSKDIVVLRIEANNIKNKLYLDPENPPTEYKDASLFFIYLGIIKPELIEYASRIKFEGANLYANNWKKLKEVK